MKRTCEQITSARARRAAGKHPAMKTLTPAMFRLSVGLWLFATAAGTVWSQTATGTAPTSAPATPPATPAPPPSAPAKLGAAELEKLLMPIALYPDALIATLLPASVYPLEIVQAARFVADTNNLAKLDAQPWDESVKALARVPAALQKLNDDLQWTIQLGEAFLNQDKDVMDMIQSLRMKAQKAGTLRTTEQQVVTVTNLVVETRVEQQVVVVTNTIVQIEPANPQVVYVPSYPYTVYYPPPAYVYNPYAPLVTFAAGVAVGAIIWNNCDWHHGGCYWGGGDVDIDIDVDRNVNRDRTTSRPSSTTGRGQKWQPDQNRLSRSGAGGASAATREARGWGSGAPRPSTGAVGARPATGAVGARPSTGTPSVSRPATGARTTSTWQQPAAASRPAPSPSVNRQSPQPSSAFSGVGGGNSAREYSNRGATSRSSGGLSSGGFGGGGTRGGFSGGGARGGGRR